MPPAEQFLTQLYCELLEMTNPSGQLGCEFELRPVKVLLKMQM